MDLFAAQRKSAKDDEEDFNSAIRSALGSNDIKKLIKDAGASTADVDGMVLSVPQLIRDAATDEYQAYRLGRQGQLLAVASEKFNGNRLRLLYAAYKASDAVSMLIVVSVIVAARRNIAAAVPIIIFTGLLTTYVNTALKVRFKRKSVPFGSARELEEKTLQLRKAWLEAVKAKGVYPLVNSIITQRLGANYSHRLDIAGKPSLDATFEPEYFVPTVASRRLTALLSRMRGGSIAITGPRGAGKSTLLRYACVGRTLSSPEDDPLGVIVSAPVEYSARDFILHLFAVLCVAVADHYDGDLNIKEWEERPKRGPLAISVAGIFLGALIFFLNGFVSVRKFWEEITHNFPGTYSGTIAAALILGGVTGISMNWPSVKQMIVGSVDQEDPVVIARRSFRRIRMLQTYTSGWSGALNTRVGIEAGVTRSIALATQPLSYPEIVHEFRNFLAKIGQVMRTEGRRIVIGIDELDKISSAEQARQLVNDLKAVFGVPYCHFVISVSDEAIEPLKTHGVHGRGGLNGIFDEIFDVGYLDLNGSRDIIQRRMIDLPEPFLVLAHCLSGGLPRDLIRIVRNIVDFSMSTGMDQLEQISRYVIHDELYRHGDAFRRSCARPGLHGVGDRILGGLSIQPDDVLSIDAMSSICTGLMFAMKEYISSDTSLAEEVSEYATFVYFFLTLVEVFTRSLSPSNMQYACRDGVAGSFDSLARSRREIAFSGVVAWQKISEFRVIWNLRVLSYTD